MMRAAMICLRNNNSDQCNSVFLLLFGLSKAQAPTQVRTVVGIENEHRKSLG